MSDEHATCEEIDRLASTVDTADAFLTDFLAGVTLNGGTVERRGHIIASIGKFRGKPYAVFAEFAPMNRPTLHVELRAHGDV